jgi:hypothetical protein
MTDAAASTAEFSLGIDCYSKLVKVDGLRVGDHHQVDSVLDAAAAFAAGVNVEQSRHQADATAAAVHAISLNCMARCFIHRV